MAAPSAWTAATIGASDITRSRLLASVMPGEVRPSS
jgi:hypothetical protein